jgi:type I restriction-modification system DNA methylase subunit
VHAKRKKIYKKNNAGSNLFKELWNAAVALRGSIEPADYKRYVLPLIFLRFLSLRYEQRVSEIEAEIADPQSDLFTRDVFYVADPISSIRRGRCKKRSNLGKMLRAWAG